MSINTSDQVIMSSSRKAKIEVHIQLGVRQRMEVEPENNNKKKGGSILMKLLERYLSMRNTGRKPRHINNGCFSVYVGAERRRFVIKAKHANHPLFRTLLEDAASEFGFRSDGPLELPCEVDQFRRVLAEMESEARVGNGSCGPFVNPGRRLGPSHVARGYGSYGLLAHQPRWLKLVHHF